MGVELTSAHGKRGQAGLMPRCPLQSESLTQDHRYIPQCWISGLYPLGLH